MFRKLLVSPIIKIIMNHDHACFLHDLGNCWKKLHTNHYPISHPVFSFTFHLSSTWLLPYQVTPGKLVRPSLPRIARISTAEWGQMCNGCCCLPWEWLNFTFKITMCIMCFLLTLHFFIIQIWTQKVSNYWSWFEWGEAFDICLLF